MNKTIWRAELLRSPKTKSTEALHLWRPLPTGEYLRIAPNAAPVEVQELLCLLPDHGGTLMESPTTPVHLDFKKLSKSAGQRNEFFRTFTYVRSRRKYQPGLLADCSFEVQEPAGGFKHERLGEIYDLPSQEEMLTAGQRVAEQLLAAEFPDGLPENRTYDQLRRFELLRQAVGLSRKPAPGEKPASDWCYCAYCGNVKVPDRARPCAGCMQSLRGRLAIAWEVYKTYQQTDSQCCGGLSRDKSHFHYHGKYWECSYPPKAERKDEPASTCVEMGVNLYHDRAETYWIFDNDSMTESNVYGDPIPYTDPDFWNKVEAQLNRAAEEAFNSDICSCEHCGYHYHVGNGPCGCAGSEEDA